MTWVVYFSGVHGSGKTTIRSKVAQRLQKAGLSVYAFPEFSYIPDIPMGTPEFQLWYRTQLRIRQELIQYLVNTKYFDIIIVDRHPVDEKIYAKRLGGDQQIEYTLDNHSIHFFIHRSTSLIVSSLKKRNELEDHRHRKDWNEIDINYLNTIKGDFLGIREGFGKDRYMPQLINDLNDDCEAPVNEALRIIMELIP